jgi:hypothetical protein
MSDLYERLRLALPDAEFGPPATEQQIAQAERALQTTFPDWLRQLYLKCNGISGHEFNDPYLYPLETPGHDDTYTLVGWNQFLRGTCDQLRETYESDGDLPLWEKTHAKNYLIIGYENGTNWAIDIKTGRPQIIWYDERNPGDYSVLGEDLADVCAKNEAKNREIHNQLYRGRQAIRRDDATTPPTCDVEHIIDLLIDLARGSRSIPISIRESGRPNLNFYQRLKATPEEPGALFILEANHLLLSIATRDGNVPFVLRAKLDWTQEPLHCLVHDLPDALLRIMLVVELARDRNATDNQRTRRIDASRTVFELNHGPPDPDFERLADYLFARDDRRLEEANQLGN